MNDDKKKKKAEGYSLPEKHSKYIISKAILMGQESGGIVNKSVALRQILDEHKALMELVEQNEALKKKLAKKLKAGD